MLCKEMRHGSDVAGGMGHEDSWGRFPARVSRAAVVKGGPTLSLYTNALSAYFIIYTSHPSNIELPDVSTNAVRPPMPFARAESQMAF